MCHRIADTSTRLSQKGIPCRTRPAREGVYAGERTRFWTFPAGPG
jgi:hypothetical protein